MAINQDLAAKGFKKLLILVGLLIASPLLLTLSFKALKLYTKGTLFFNQTESSSDNDSPSTITTNVLQLLIFDPEEREYTWTY